MPVFIRLAVGLPFAAIAAVLLFLCMRLMVAAAEPSVEAKAPPPVFDLWQEVVEIEPKPKPTRPELKPVTPPPPTPVIRTAEATQPTEGMVAIGGRIPEFGRPELGHDMINFAMIDTDTQPVIRVSGAYPMRAQERGLEGYCLMRFDVGADGTPVNIEATRCTSGLFESASIRAVERWRYNPKIQNGAAVVRRGVETRIDYTLGD